jgi:hypothetical protein
MRYVMLIAAVLVATLSGAAFAGSETGKAEASASAPAATQTKELTLQEKVSTLVKGKATYDEAIRLLGKPAASGDGPYGRYVQWANTGWFSDGYFVRLDFNENGILVSKVSGGGE